MNKNNINKNLPFQAPLYRVSKRAIMALAVLVLVAIGGNMAVSDHTVMAATNYQYGTTLMKGSKSKGGATIKVCKITTDKGSTLKLKHYVYSDGRIISTSFDADKYVVTKTLNKGTYTQSRAVRGTTFNYSSGTKNMGAQGSIAVDKISGC